MQIKDNSLREEYDKNGFVRIRNVFTKEEVVQLRQSCENSHVGCVLGQESFNQILLDDRIIKPVQEILNDEVIYFGESTALSYDKASTKGHRHYHNDSRGDDFNFNNDYPIVRIGIYLQDHEHYSGGLKLRPGSHKKLCLEKHGVLGALSYLKNWKKPSALFSRPSFNTKVMPGDLLIWSLRIHHTGYALRPKLFTNLALHPVIENYLPQSFVLPDAAHRCVIFATFGAKSEYLERYIQNRVHRQDMKNHWRGSKFDTPIVVNKAKAIGVNLRFDGIEAL